MATIQKFSGLQYPNAKDPLLQQAWRNNNYQYATSSHQVDHDMNPGLIVQPNNEKDIIAAVQYAKQEKLAVAIASGGHQYSGACSTSGKNILVDLKKTFLDSKQDLRILGKEEVGVLVKRVIQDPQIQQEKSAKTFVYASVSWSLGSFNGFLKQNKCFVPHGQCIDVRVGGHAQTGGYGQLGRSFGLLGDHVWEIRLIDHDAEIKVVDKASDPELFHAILGGSPGNFGVITHYTMEVHRDSEYDFIGADGPRGIRAVWWYNQDTLEALLKNIAEMGDDPDTPRNYDLCVSVLSSDFPLLHLIPGLDQIMKRDHPNIFGFDGLPDWPPTIILYAQWVPLAENDRYDPKWFSDLANAGKWRLKHDEFGKDTPKRMSEMTGEWIFRNIREFDHPYEKRTYLTNSTTLVRDGWVEQVSKRVHRVISPSLKDEFLQCWVSCQIQCFGGKNSMFTRNADNGTSYSWRDSTVCCTLDCFVESSYKHVAEDL
ncbi:hypothetical protein LTR09_009716 [Extremus antarcticus]|uniref:FAD-binding PCMH-type domain-containing protein n=1 Tax=Extremus antarcticus TaxID=702011 RepID=A0AAJ0DFE5_9PEZI|nr:hypothetical protein LTR09_009716 [Extremus antarcticus]